MLKCDSPCHPASPDAWRYIATLLTDDDAKLGAFRGYSAPDLFSRDGKTYLMATRVSAKPWKGSYSGCDIFRFVNLETAALEKDHGRLRIVGQVQGTPGSFNGAAPFSLPLPPSAISTGEIRFVDKHPFFQIFQTAAK